MPPPWGETQLGEGCLGLQSWETMGSVRATQLSADLNTQPIEPVPRLQLQTANLVLFFMKPVTFCSHRISGFFGLF